MTMDDIAEAARKKSWWTDAVENKITAAYKKVNNTQTVPAWRDAVTYNNFKKANPTLEVTPEDTAHMLSAWRNKATVATAANPVTDRTPQAVIWVPDYSSLDWLDRNGLTDYIDAIEYKQMSGTKVSVDDALKARKAQRMLQELAQKETVNPNTQAIETEEANKTARAAELKAATEGKVWAYESYLNTQTEQAKESARRNAERETQAQQSASSFSWFGRSTFNQDQIGQIQERATEAMAALDQAKNYELLRYKAEQEGADAETLAAYDTQINQYRTQAAEREASAIENANAINAASNASYEEKVNNLLAAAMDTAKTYEDLTDEEQQAIMWYAGVILDDKWNIDADVLKSIPAGLSAYVINEAAKLRGWLPWEAADTVTTGSGKSAKTYQRNPETGRYDIPVGWSWFGGGWGWGGVGWLASGIPLWPMNADLLSNLYKVAKSVANSSVRSSWLIDPDAKLALWYITSNLTLDKITELKKNGVSLWALSEWEWAALANSIGWIWPGNSKDVALEQLNRMIRNAWGIPLSKEDAKKWMNPIAPTTPNATTWAGIVAPTQTTIDDLR